VSHRRWKFRIDDILLGISKARKYCDGKDLAGFVDDDLTVDAVICNLIVVGEAAHHIDPAKRSDLPGIPWQLLIDLRNLAVHEYWGVDRQVIWRTVTSDLPPIAALLRDAVDRITDD
jgi:uncharacterized protein with HEPN domain